MPNLLELRKCFKPIDAAKHDPHFIEKFLLHDDMPLLLDDDTFLISGEKGSGKTAICKYLEQTSANSKFLVKGLPFNDLRHADVVHYVSDLARTSGIDSIALMSAFWRCVILTSAMQLAFEKWNFNVTPTEHRMVNYLRKTENMDTSPVELFIGLTEKVWNLLDIFTGTAGKAPKALLSLPPDSNGNTISTQHLSFLKKYPYSDDDYFNAEVDFSEALQTRDVKITVYLDGFDVLRGDSAQDKKSLNLLFTSLIDAVYQISLEGKWQGRLSVKALIPHDRWLEQTPRDLDKLRGVHKSILWKYAHIKEFTRKRIALFLNAGIETNFSLLWGQFFPDKIFNTCYRLQEDTFDYILRHTQYRPRQLQMHIIKLCEEFKSTDVRPSKIPNIIAVSCKERVRDFIEEFRIDHPKMERFLQQFKDCENVLTYRDFGDRIEKALTRLDVSNINANEKIERLYKIGFAGYLRHLEDHEYEAKKHAMYFAPNRVDGKRYKCEFYYEEGASSDLRDLSDNDLVCIHPMFFDYCRLKPHPKYIVG